MYEFLDCLVKKLLSVDFKGTGLELGIHPMAVYQFECLKKCSCLFIDGVEKASQMPSPLTPIVIYFKIWHFFNAKLLCLVLLYMWKCRLFWEFLKTHHMLLLKFFEMILYRFVWLTCPAHLRNFPRTYGIQNQWEKIFIELGINIVEEFQASLPKYLEVTFKHKHEGDCQVLQAFFFHGYLEFVLNDAKLV